MSSANQFLTDELVPQLDRKAGVRAGELQAEVKGKPIMSFIWGCIISNPVLKM